MLYELWLLDIPKLMDVAVLYGTHNLELTCKFLEQVFGALRTVGCYIGFEAHQGLEQRALKGD